MDVTTLPKIVADFTPGAAGIWTLVLMAAAYFAREWRETRKLSSEDKQARREGYAKQVESLTAENRELRADLAAFEKRHDDYRRMCHQENDQLRDTVIGLEHRISGLLRKLADIAVRAARGEMTPETASLIAQMAAEASTPLPTIPRSRKRDYD